MTKFVPDKRYDSVPKLPTDRPPTKQETWAHYHHLYFDLKGHREYPGCTPMCKHTDAGELEAFCREGWLYKYVEAYNLRDWRKQPNWCEGQEVIPEAVPDSPFMSGDPSANRKTIEALLETAAQLQTRRAA